MTGTSTSTGTTTSVDGRGSTARVRVWARDLAMGARFAVSGGRQGWIRTLLTAVGVGLGVAVLLLAASVPEMVAGQDARKEARPGAGSIADPPAEPSAYSILTKDANTRYHSAELYGRLVQPEGDSPATPPGVRRLPAPGEMVVSPALKRMLNSPEGKPLVDRLDGRVVGTIGDDGLVGPAELAFYKGATHLSVGQGAQRATHFGGMLPEQPMDPTLLLLVVVACAVLVMPVAVFVATAVRFGGEQRDARLAALRLVGADAAMTRRMAAGESLVGALLGLLLGGWFFLLGRAFIGRIELFGLSVFPADVAPRFALGLLITVGVPVAAVAVTVFALRGVAIEPLGLVRKSEQRPRRLWWRLLPPAAGAALLLPMAGSLTGSGASVNEVQVTGATVLLLSGVALLLPWLVERIVGRLRGGPVSWQLATRRLQLSSGNATRAVSGITIAVAGAIALQMLFAAVETEETRPTGKDPATSQATVYGPHSTVAEAAALTAGLKRAQGVRDARGYLQTYVEAKGLKDGTGVTVGSCATLRGLARIDNCRDGQVFLARSGKSESSLPHPGTSLTLDDGKGADGGKGGKGAKAVDSWRVPQSARTVRAVKGPDGSQAEGVLATPSALSEKRLTDASYQGWVLTDPADREAVERIRTTVFHVDPAISLFQTTANVTSGEFASIRRAVLAAAVAVLLLIGASMIVSTLEQLRERKRQLSVLVAFGTRRSTLGASVLWQTAVPVVLGIGLAVVFGLGLGWGLLRLLSAPASGWLVFLPVAGAGAAVIALVTLVSLPFLWRMMRPEGLRTE